MSRPDARARLAQQQGELVQALTGRGGVPAGFEPEQVSVAARSLANKRRREVAHAWPALVRALGECFTDRFAAFAATVPLPAEGGPLADGRAFADTLEAGERTDEVRLAVLGVDMHQRRTAMGLVPRRGVVLKWAWLWEARRLVIGVRLPWLGVWVLAVPLALIAGPRMPAGSPPRAGD
jgi:hypothetical protein